MRGHSQEAGWALLESRNIPFVKFGTTEEAVILLKEKMHAKES
jgi:succinyl-CoA synthetase beta subunit